MAQKIKIVFSKDENDEIKKCTIAEFSYLDYLTPSWVLNSNCANCKDLIQVKIYFEDINNDEKASINNKHEIMLEEIQVDEPKFEESYEIEIPVASSRPAKRKRNSVEQHDYDSNTVELIKNENCEEEMIEERLDEEFEVQLSKLEPETEVIVKPKKVVRKYERKPQFRGLYTCDMCSVQYATLALLRRHVNYRHLPERPIKYLCSHCKPEKPFKTIQAYAWHMHNHHPGVDFKAKKFNCPVCNEEFRTLDDRVDHYKTCGPKTNKPSCHLCHKTFTTWKSAVQHVEVMHLKISKYVCDICGHKSPRRRSHIEHMIIHKHNDDPRPYKCDLCRKGFKMLKSLKNHLAQIHKFASDEESVCDLCGETFPTRATLGYHVARTHKEREVFTCEVCNKELLTKYSLKMHMNMVHTELPETEKFPCDQCNYVGVKQRYLELHKLQHADAKDKPKCSYCGKTFINKNLVKRHEMIHTDSRPHICSICNRCFRHAFDLTSHMRLHTGKSSVYIMVQLNLADNHF